ncbi:MAG: insulinase family protein [Cyanobacteria bacterium SIG26]|nr:insulinase family protein [Cyanobacteria bacterium SIG26]
MKKILILAALFLGGNFVWASEAQLFRLDNGQTVVIQEVHNNPIVVIDTWVKTGSIDEDDSNSGVAHFLEHLFFKGTKNHEPGEFDRILETKGAITNAATSKDFTHYYVTIPSKDFDLAVELHADMMMNPLVPRNEMERERKVVLEEINKDLKSPTRILQDNLNSMLYTEHPYKRKVIGKSEVIETITRDQVLSFYKKNYSPSNMITIVIGDVNTEHALQRIKETFNGQPQKQTKNIYPKEEILNKQVKKVEYLPTESGYMVVGFRGVPIDEKDSYALDVLATILGDGRSSVLNQVIKEKKRLAFSVDAGNTTFKDDGIFYVMVNFEPQNCKQIQDTIFEEIEKIQNQGVTEEQVNLAKNIIERTTYYARESITNIATEIGYTMTLTNDIKFYDTYLDQIKCVTKEQVKKVANKYLGLNKSAVSIILPENAKEIPVSHSVQNLGTAELVNSSNGTEKYKLSNGSTLLYTQNSVNDIIAISINIKGGQFVESIPGTANLTASTMLKGTKNYTSLELSQVLEDNGIKIVPSTRADAFLISVLTTKDEFCKTLELLDEIVNNATFDDFEVEKVKTNKLNSIKQSKDIAIQQAAEIYRDLIYRGTPYSISARVLEQNLPNIKRQDIVDYYNNLFNPNNMVISINGNVDKDFAIQELNKIFSKTCDLSFDYTIQNSRISYIDSARESVLKMPTTETAWVMLGWQVDGILNDKDYATLQVIDSILGTGMSSRLFKNLRDQQGLAYQLGSGYSPNVLRGSFMLYIGTNPNTLDVAKEGLFKEINRLKTEYVGDKELKDAKEKLLGNYVIGLETNLDKATTIAWYETSTKGYEFKDRYEELINSVTDSDIIEVANKYFTDNYIMSVVTKE